MLSCKKEDKTDPNENPNNFSGGGIVYFSGKVINGTTMQPMEGETVWIYPTSPLSLPVTSNTEGIYLTSYAYSGTNVSINDTYPGNIELYVLTDSSWGSAFASDIPFPKNGDTIFTDILVYPEAEIVHDLEISLNPSTINTWSSNSTLTVNGSISSGGVTIPVDSYSFNGEDRFGNTYGLSGPSTLWTTNVSGIHDIYLRADFKVREGITGPKTIVIDTLFYVTQMYPWVYGLSSTEHKILRDKFVGNWDANCISTWGSEWNATFAFDSVLHYTGEVTEQITGLTPVSSVFDYGHDYINFPERRFFIDSVDANGKAFGSASVRKEGNSTIKNWNFGNLYFTNNDDSLYFTIYRSSIVYINYALKRD